MRRLPQFHNISRANMAQGGGIAMRPLPMATAILLLGVACAGCGSRTEADYTPSPERSRQALTAALDAWQRGEPPGRIEGTPAVQIGDTLRKPGQKLKS